MIIKQKTIVNFLISNDIDSKISYEIIVKEDNI